MFDRHSNFRLVPVQCDEKKKHQRLSLGAFAFEKRDEMAEMINTVSPHIFNRVHTHAQKQCLTETFRCRAMQACVTPCLTQ
jgi:hypothetical protein